MSHRALHVLGLIVSAALATTVIAAPSSQASTLPSAAASIRWTSCAQPRPYQCADVVVPLDWKHPAAGSTTIAIERRRASVPSKRLGAIFVNPGGPGESAIEKTASFAELLGRSITDRFDIVAIDPRGVASSGKLWCATKPGVTLPPSLAPRFPATVGEAGSELKYVNQLQLACKQTAGALLAHMTTADDARDMDHVRALLGDSKLSFVGFSYGTVLGQTYAAMYPHRVRAMVLDGVLDAKAWTGGPDARSVPVGGRIHSGEGAWEAVKQAYAQCVKAGKAKCASASGGLNEWTTAYNRLVKSPITVQGTKVTWADLVTNTLFALYDPTTVPEALDDVHRIYRSVIGKPLPASAAAAKRMTATSKRPAFGWAAAESEWSAESQNAVTCSDSVNPTDPWANWRVAMGTRAATSGFNSAWTWNTAACTLWPASGGSAYRGPFNVRPATPILFMNPLYDSATSLASARIAHANSPGSRLVTGNRVGHILLNDSACAVKIRTRYLLTQQLPGKDVACTDVKKLY